MIPRAQLDDIDETVIRTLLGVTREGRTLDFKEALDLTREGRQALAEDVCAFANTVGGDLVFGVREEAGVASDVVPVALDDPDAVLLQLTSSLRDLVEPRVTTTLLSRAVALAAGGYVVVLRVGQSPNAPHRVSRTGQFYLRNSVGKEPMDIHAIRTAFAFADSLAERAIAFRNLRMHALGHVGAPRPLQLAPLVVLHFIPLSALTRREAHTVEQMKAAAQHLVAATPVRRQPLRGIEVNYEGVICSADRDGEGRIGGYAQLFRDGSIELAGCLDVHPLDGGDSAIHPAQYELPFVQEALPAILRSLAALDVAPPAYLFVSLRVSAGMHVGFQVPLEFPQHPKLPPHLTEILSPPVYVEDFGHLPLDLLGPVLAPLWNAVGEDHSRTQFV